MKASSDIPRANAGSHTLSNVPLSPSLPRSPLPSPSPSPLTFFTASDVRIPVIPSVVLGDEERGSEEKRSSVSERKDCDKERDIGRERQREREERERGMIQRCSTMMIVHYEEGGEKSVSGAA